MVTTWYIKNMSPGDPGGEGPTQDLIEVTGTAEQLTALPSEGRFHILDQGRMLPDDGRWRIRGYSARWS
jgi:hypothetical protein